MNGAHWHLLVNHFPVVLQLVGLPVAIYGAIRKQAAIQQLGYIILIGAALFTVASYTTGNDADEILKNYPEIVRASVEQHIQAAEWGLRAGIFVGIFSAFLWVRMRMGRTIAKGWWIGHAVVALWALSVFSAVSHWGGVIRHPEINAVSKPQP